MRAVAPNPGKVPRIANWRDQATYDSVTIAEWFDQWPDSNLGMITGSEVGIIGVDVDGVYGMERLEELFGDKVPPTWQFSTPGGGFRYLFNVSNGLQLRKYTDNSRCVILEWSVIQAVEVPEPSISDRIYDVYCRLPAIPVDSDGEAKQLTRKFSNIINALQTKDFVAEDISAVEAVQAYLEKAINEALSDSMAKELKVCRQVGNIDN